MPGSSTLRLSRRRRAVTTLVATMVLALAIAPAGALGSEPTVITMWSDTTWDVSDADVAVGPSLTLPAKAQAVCLNETSPSNCPSDIATYYGWAGSGWGANDAADFSEAFPAALWIWAPEITGATSPADNDTYHFSREFELPSAPTGAHVWIAVDDNAEVFVNGTSAGTASGNASITKLDITSLLVAGPNEFVVRASNGLICNATCPYSSNPAGVLFGIAIVGTTGPSNPTLPPTSALEPGAATSAPSSVAWIVVLAAGSLVAAGLTVPGRRRR